MLAEGTHVCLVQHRQLLEVANDTSNQVVHTQQRPPSIAHLLVYDLLACRREVGQRRDRRVVRRGVEVERREPRRCDVPRGDSRHVPRRGDTRQVRSGCAYVSEERLVHRHGLQYKVGGAVAELAVRVAAEGGEIYRIVRPSCRVVEGLVDILALPVCETQAIVSEGEGESEYTSQLRKRARAGAGHAHIRRTGCTA